jgi:siroheme synthase
VVQDGTINSQKVVTGILATMADQVAQQGLRSPCLIIIGTVVNLHGALAWFRPPLGAAP